MSDDRCPICGRAVPIVQAERLCAVLRRLIQTYDGGAVTRPEFYKAVQEGRELLPSEAKQ